MKSKFAHISLGNKCIFYNNLFIRVLQHNEEILSVFK